MTLSTLDRIGKMSRRLTLLIDHITELSDEVTDVQKQLEIAVQEIIREER